VSPGGRDVPPGADERAELLVPIRVFLDLFFQLFQVRLNAFLRLPRGVLEDVVRLLHQLPHLVRGRVLRQLHFLEGDFLQAGDLPVVLDLFGVRGPVAVGPDDQSVGVDVFRHLEDVNAVRVVVRVADLSLHDLDGDGPFRERVPLVFVHDADHDVAVALGGGAGGRAHHQQEWETRYHVR
jgi:hypothetical protein